MARRKLRIVGSGSYLPKKKVLGTDIDRKLGLSAGTATRTSGVEYRHFVDGETNSQMAAYACMAALENARLKYEDIDLIINASASYEQPLPYGAALIQLALGKENSGTPCFDVNSTCLSFVTALDLASFLLDSGKHQRIMIVSSEIASVGLNWTHLEAASLFGDGAVAMVIERSLEDSFSGVITSRMETYSAGWDTCEIRAGGTKFHPAQWTKENTEDYLFSMNGRKVFRLVSERIDSFVTNLLENVGSGIQELSDFDLIIPHQASASAMELMRRRIKVPENKWMTIIKHHGNMIAASIPMALHIAIEENRVKRGDRILLIGTSAGFSIGAVALEY